MVIIIKKEILKKGRVKDLIKKYFSVFCAFIITSFILLFSFYTGGLYPFGEGTISWCDMNQQVIPLINNFKDIMESGNGLFHNFNNAGGMNFYGVFFFFLSSPLTFLCLLVEKSDIPLFMNILVLLKMALAAACAAVFFSKRYEHSPLLLKIVFSVSFGLGGYGMLFYQNIIWLDIMILFPLLMLSLYHLLEKGKMLPLTILLTLSIIINYYLSFMLIIFIVLFFGINLIFKKVEKAIQLKLGLSALISLMISAPVWIPSLLQIGDSARGENIINNLKYSDFLTPYETVLPILFSASFLLGLFILGIIFGKIPTFKRKYILCVLSLMPLIIEPINLMWHTGSYMAFPARYGFIPIFLLLELGFDIINSIKSEKSKGVKFIILGVSTSLILGGFILWFIKNNIETLSSYTQTLWGNKESFEGLLIAFLVGLIGVAALFILLSYKKISKKVFALSLCILVLFESLSSVSVYMVSAKDKFNMEKYQSLITLSENFQTDSFKRIKMQEKYFDVNMLGGASAQTLAHYTSLNSLYFMEAAKGMGYSGYWMEINSSGGTILSDALLRNYCTINRIESGTYTLKENLIFPALIYTNSPLSEVLSGERVTALDNALSGMLGGSKALKYQPDSHSGYFYEDNIYSLYKDGEIDYTIRIIGQSELYFDLYNGFSNSLIEPINDSLSVYVNHEEYCSLYPTQDQNGILHLGTFKDETVNIKIKVLKDITASSFGVYSIDTQSLNDAAKNLKGGELKIENGILKGFIEKDTPENVFISLPYKEGLKITIGGEEVEPRLALSGFLTFKTNGLSGELKISFVPKGFFISLIISTFGILLLILSLYLLNKKRFPIIETTAKILFLLVFALVILGVYLLPLGINLIA